MAGAKGNSIRERWRNLSKGKKVALGAVLGTAALGTAAVVSGVGSNNSGNSPTAGTTTTTDSNNSANIPITQT